LSWARHRPSAPGGSGTVAACRGGLSYTTNPTIKDARQFDVKNYWQLGNDNGLVIITPVFG
jgi:hypothetical protein